MNIILSRLDNRLLHGVVATQWGPKSQAQRIMVIDDIVANDAMLKNSMKLARPAGMAISIITTEKAIVNFKANKYQGQKIFIIMRNVERLEELLDQVDLPINEVNLGATAQIGSEENVPYKTLTKVATCKEHEQVIYKKLMGKGIEFYVQYLPKDKRLSLEDLID